MYFFYKRQFLTQVWEPRLLNTDIKHLHLA